MWKRFPPERPRTPIGEVNWLEWMGIEKTDRDTLVEKARAMNIPVFKDDSERDIYERIQSASNLRNNKITVYINIFLTVISLFAFVVSAVGLYRS